ncbi:MAG: hypothetical protein ACYCOU_00105 [Sulfobacillus sp.]
MALIDMMSEITELVPAMSRIRAKTLINRSWKYVQDSMLWSFQLQQGGFSTPNISTDGSITATLGSPTIVGDLNATISWNALPLIYSPTVQQFRAQGYSIYSIISLTGNGSIAYATITSDGVGQTPGTYTYDVLDGAGTGTGAAVSITVETDGTVTDAPVVLSAGSGYVQPYINFAEGGTPATFTFTQFAVLTLDRPFIDPLPFYSGVGYQMYYAYIAMPPGFKRFLTVADMFDMWSMDLWTSRRTIDLDDPTRLLTSNPTTMAALGVDRRGAGTSTPSATLGQQLYEMYPYPSTPISYQWYGVVEFPYLIKNSDTLPYPIDEELVTQKALTWAYRDAEGRKDIMAAKGSGGNYLGLKSASEEDFLIRLKTLRLLDRDAVDSYFVDMRAATSGFPRVPYFNSTTRQTGPGW